MRISTCLLIVALACVSASHMAAANPEVRSPQDGQKVGIPGDPLCATDKPCAKIRAVGWIEKGRVPFFAVAPVKAAPRIWIQPPVTGVRADGTFSGVVNLGESHNGAGEWFKIYVFGCESPDRFAETDEIVKLPTDCDISDPVEVYRER